MLADWDIEHIITELDGVYDPDLITMGYNIDNSFSGELDYSITALKRTQLTALCVLIRTILSSDCIYFSLVYIRTGVYYLIY